MASTVLIASAEHLPLLKERDEFGDALSFADADALLALDAITEQRPAVIALEKLFAATSRGTALINRIKADPALSACEIRVVSHDGALAVVGARAGGTAAAPVAVVETAAPAAQLDAHGTRRAPRFDIVDGVEVMIDGNPAVLIDLSTVGAQVKSATSLKPNQRVRMTLPDPKRAIRFNGSIAWAKFEMPKEGPRYRAGVEFFGAESDAVQRFIDANKKPE